MIVAITDGRANISLKRSTDPEAVPADAPRPTTKELKVCVLGFVLFTLKEQVQIRGTVSSMMCCLHLILC